MDLLFGSLLYVLYTFDYFLKVLLEKSQFLVLQFSKSFCFCQFVFFFDFANFLKVQSVGLRGDEGTHIVLPFRPELAGNEDGSFTLFHTFFL